MPKRGAVALSLTALALVLLLNFQVPSGIDVARGAGGTGSTGGTALGTGIGPAQGSGNTPAQGNGNAPAQGSGNGSGAAPLTGSQTFTGPTVNTRFGPVQVSVTLDGSQITEVTALQLPAGDRRSSQISNRAEPILRSEALQAQGAAIDGVSGATYTSTAYATSLQAALDSAGG
jgi:uncharacterized protein with FMN-binding domain